MKENNGNETKFKHKRGYHTYSNVIFGWVACFLLSSSGFCCVAWRFLRSLDNITKSRRGTPPGPRSVVEAGVSEAPGLHYTPRARRCAQTWFCNIVQRSQKTSSYQQKARAISKKHAISQKNVAICIIDYYSKGRLIFFSAWNIPLPTYLPKPPFDRFFFGKKWTKLIQCFPARIRLFATTNFSKNFCTTWREPGSGSWH